MVVVSAVLSIYSKSGGKNGTHSWVAEASSVAAISYIPVQIFEHVIGRHFRAIPQTLTWLQVKQFTLLPASAFLCVLDSAPWRIMETQNFQVSVTDSTRYDKLVKQEQKIILILKSINSRRRKGAEEANEREEDEEG